MPLEFPSLGKKGLAQTAEDEIQSFIRKLLDENPETTPEQLLNLTRQQFPDADQIDIDRIVSGLALPAVEQPKPGEIPGYTYTPRTSEPAPYQTTFPELPAPTKLPVTPPQIVTERPQIPTTPGGAIPPPVPPKPQGKPTGAIPGAPWGQSYNEWREEAGLPPEAKPEEPEISKIPYTKTGAAGITDLTTAQEYAKYYGMALPFSLDHFRRMAKAFLPPYELTEEQRNIISARVPINQWNAEAAFWAGIPPDVIQRALDLGGVNIAVAGWLPSQGQTSTFWDSVEQAFAEPAERSDVAERLRSMGIDPSTLGQLFQEDYENRLRLGLIGEGGTHTDLTSLPNDIIEEDGVYYRVSQDGVIKIPLIPTTLEGVLDIGESLISPLALPPGWVQDEQGNLAIPDTDIQEARQWAESDPASFVTTMLEIGENDVTKTLLKRMYPDMKDEDIAKVFIPEPIMPSSNFVNPPTQTQLDAAIQNFTIMASKKITLPGGLETYDTRSWLMGGLGVMGAFLEKYVGRPWEFAILYTDWEIGNIINKIKPGYNAKSEAVEKILTDAANKYGWAMVFSDDVSDAWEIAFGEAQKVWSGAKYVKTAAEFANPIYIVPIGEGFGLAANASTKIPIIGKALKYTAASVQAVERGATYPVAKPLELGIKGVMKGGAKLTEKFANQLINQSAHSATLERFMATSEGDILNAALKDNWMKRALTTVSKVPPIKAAVEKGLGWRILTQRMATDVENSVGRGAIIWSYYSRGGKNAAAVKVLELRAILNKPVKYFGFDETAFSETMLRKLKPEFEGLKEAGTLEHVFTKPQCYDWTNMEKGFEYIQKVQEVDDLMLDILKKEGIPPENIIDDWIHRVVVDVKGARGAPKLRRGGKAIGAKPTYEKPRRFETMADGRQYFMEHPELGKAYANNPELLIRDYIEQAFKHIADHRFEQYVAGWGITISERLQEMSPEAWAAWQMRPITERIGQEMTIREQVADLGYALSVVKRAARGETLPNATLAAIQRRNPQIYKRLWEILNTGGPDKLKTLKALSKEMSAELETLKPDWWKAKTAYTKGMELARQPSIGMGYLPEPFAGGKIYTQDFIETFNKYFKAQPGGKALQVTTDVAGILRMTKASLDFSAMAIQGLPSWGLAHSYLLWNPKQGFKLLGGWYKGFAMSVGVAFDPRIAARYFEKNSASIMQRLARDGSAVAGDYLVSAESRITEKMAHKIPFYERANLSFFTATEIVRDEFWKVLSPRCKNVGQEFELAQFLDRITGIYDSAAAGIPVTTRQLENSFVWFAPNYTRACLTVLSDIFRGGMTGAEARKAIGGMITAGAMMYSAIQYSMSTLEGKDNEQAMEDVLAGFGVTTDPITGETSWKPGPQFMTVKIGNYNMGFGGFWYGLLRLSGNIMACVEKVGDKEPIDLIRIVKDGSINVRDNPFIKWWYDRSSPLTGTGFELASGKDYLGYPIETPMDYAKYIATRFEPIWAEQGLNTWVPGLAKKNEVPEGAARIAVIPAELFGMRTFPESTWIKFYDKANEIINSLPRSLLEKYYPDPTELEKILDAQSKGKLQYGMLPDGLQDMLISKSAYPELAALYDESQTDSALRNSSEWKQWDSQMAANKDTYYKRCNDLAAQLRSGDKDMREFTVGVSEAGQMYGTSLREMENTKAYETIYNYLNEKQKDGGKYDWFYDRARRDYENIIYQEYLDENGDFDYEARDKDLAEFKAEYGTQIYEQIKQDIASKKLSEGLDPLVVSRPADMEKVKPYYDLKDPTGDPDREARKAFRDDPKNWLTEAILVFRGKVTTIQNPEKQKVEEQVKKWCIQYNVPEKAIPAFGADFVPKKAEETYQITQATWTQWRDISKQDKRPDEIEYDQWQFLKKHPEMNTYLVKETGRKDARLVFHNPPPSDKFLETYEKQYDVLRTDKGKADVKARYTFRGENCWFDAEGVRSGYWKRHPKCFAQEMPAPKK